jgi:hypothetical protein
MMVRKFSATPVSERPIPVESPSTWPLGPTYEPRSPAVARNHDRSSTVAKRSGATIVDWFYDPAVSGADPIEARPGLSALLDRLESNGVRTVVVEDASRATAAIIALSWNRCTFA